MNGHRAMTCGHLIGAARSGGQACRKVPFPLFANVYTALKAAIMFAVARFPIAVFAYVFPIIPAFSQTAAQQQIQITATVGKSCTINGSSTGGASAAVIPVTAGSVVTTAITPTNSPYANVVCNAPSTIQLESQQGGVLNSGTVPSGYTNIIDYSASATWNSVTATIDTSTVSGAAGTESGTAQPVAAGSGSMSVSITPELNTLPLIGGTYADTLNVILTPQ